ncbi:MAG: EpsG family protein [Clostridia bacterium]|nr:EpsG family protein [Clostridia bacterium]
MVVYFGLLVWVLFFSGVAQFARNKENRKGLENFSIFMVIVGMVYVYTIRWGVGTDFYTYKENYELIGPRTFEFSKTLSKEWLFNIMVWGIYQIRPNDFVFYNMIMGIITYAITVKSLQKSTDKIFLALMFYMLIYYTYAFNGTRQMLAVVILFMGKNLLDEKKYVPYFILALIAWKIHSTAIMVLPFFFLGKMKYDDKRLIFIEISVAIVSLFVVALWDNVLDILEMLGFEKLAEDYEDITGSHGAKFIRLLVKIPVVAVAIWRYPTLAKNDTDGKLNYYLNMSMFAIVFTIAGLKIVNLARFSDYFGIYQCLLIPKLFRSMERKDDQIILNACMIVGYILMWIVLLQVDSNLLPFRLKDGQIFN